MFDGSDISKYRVPLVVPIKDNATYADIEALPHGVNGELLGGQLWVSPRPASPHGFAATGAGAAIGSFFGGYGQGPGGWHILHEPELSLSGDCMVPDIAGWRLERMPRRFNVKAFELPPDWVCEVLSPSTRRLDRVAKLPRYCTHGVEWAWIVDPLVRTVEVFHHSDAGYVLVETFSGDEPIRARPFESVALEVERWWCPDGDPDEEG